MVNEQNPSQEERSGIFDSIKGEKSRDLDATEEPKHDQKTAEPEESAKADKTESKEPDDAEELRKEVSRLKQANAQKDRKLGELGGWAQFGMVVGGDEKGKAIVDRYQKGQPLFGEDGNMNDTEETVNPPLTEGRLTNILDQRESSKAVMDELDSIAEENLEDYNKIKRNPKFRDFYAAAQNLVWNNNIELDESVLEWQNDFAAKEYTARKKAYTMYLADSPKVREAMAKAKKLEEKDRKKALGSVPSSESTTTSSQEESESSSDSEDLVERMMNVKGRGKSFSTIGGSKR